MSDAQLLDAALRSIGAALLHSLWQGALAGGVTALVLRALGGSRPSIRYLIACTGLALMVVAWTATAWQTAAQLVPEARAAAAAPALGPAGPFDFSPAIRPISPADLEAGAPSWRDRLEGWSMALVPLWLLGVCGLSLRLALAWLWVERMRRRALLPVAEAVAARTRELAHRLSVSRPVRVVQSARVQVPSIVGWLRPVILLPASALTGLSPAHLDAVIAHELAHVRRHDFAVNVLQTAAEILLFYHPACWWISRRIRAEREHCCDDIAVSLCGDRLVYATALADLEALRGSTALALAATDGPLLQRVRRLLSPAAAAPRPSGWVAAAAPLALVLVVMTSATLTGTAASPAAAQNQPPAPGQTIPAGSGVVRGQIVDAQSGRPVAGASYEITGPMDSALGRSDDNGRFETRPIKTGTYTMSVHAKGYVMGWYGPRESPYGTPIDVRSGRISSGIDVKLYASGVINGRILDENGEGLRGVEIVLEPVNGPTFGGRRPGAAFAQTVEKGVYRITAAPGDYYVRAYVGDPLPPGKDGKPRTYVSTFYPGVRVMEEGQPLRIEAGLDLYDIDFTLASAALLRVSGRVVDPSGDSLESVRVAMMALEGPATRMRESSVGLDAEGRFEIRGVLPGNYMLNVWDKRKTSRWVGAMKHLTIDADVEDLEMRAATGALVTGRIVRDPASTRQLDMTEVNLQFEKRLTPNGFTLAGGTRIAPDGSFETESPGGLVNIGVEHVPEGWTVKSIHLDRVDIDGQAVDLSGGTRQLEVVLTDRLTTVAGLVVDRNGRPLSGYSVVLFSDDENRWTPSSRFLMEGRSSQTGQFLLKDVAPGSYLAVALRDLPFRAWVNPDNLALLRSIATKLQVVEGEQKMISIRASPTPDGLVNR